MPAGSGWTLTLKHLEIRFSKGAKMDLSNRSWEINKFARLPYHNVNVIVDVTLTLC